MLNNDLVHWF